MIAGSSGTTCSAACRSVSGSTVSPPAAKPCLVDADDDAAGVGQGGLLGQRRPRLVDDEQARAGVADDVGELERLVPAVHGDRDDPHPHRAEQERERVEAVGVEERDARAPREPRSEEPTGERRGAVAELGEAEPLAGHHDLGVRERHGAVEQRGNGLGHRTDAIRGASVIPADSSSATSCSRSRNFWIFVPDMGHSSTKRT